MGASQSVSNSSSRSRSSHSLKKGSSKSSKSASNSLAKSGKSVSNSSKSASTSVSNSIKSTSDSVSKSGKAISNQLFGTSHTLNQSRLPQYLQFDNTENADNPENTDNTENNDNTENTDDQQAAEQRENLFENKLLRYLSSDEKWIRDNNVNVSDDVIRKIIDPDNDRELTLNDLNDKGRKEFNDWFDRFTDRDTFYNYFFSDDVKQNDQYFNIDALRETLTTYYVQSEADGDNDNNNNNDGSFDEMVDRIYQKQQDQMTASTIPLRLRISELEDNKWRFKPFRVIGHWFGYKAQQYDLINGNYGMAHSSLTVGKYIVDWGAEEVIHPKAFIDEALCEIDLTVDSPWYQKMIGVPIAAISGAIAALYMFARSGGDRNQMADAYRNVYRLVWSSWTRNMVDLTDVKREKLLQLAELCVKWNKYGTYSVSECNCQDFVDQSLYALGVNINFTGNLGDFLNRVRRTGRGDIRWNGKLLETRKELDNIIRDNWNYCSKSDQQLLSSYAYMMETRRKIAMQNNDIEKEQQYSTDLTAEFRERNNIPPNPLQQQFEMN